MSDSQSDDFIPFSQSTPIQGGRQQRYYHNRRGNHQQNRFNGSGDGSFSNKWRNNSRNNSRNMNRSSFHESFNNDSCDAYIHPEMLKDPWANLQPVYIPQDK